MVSLPVPSLKYAAAHWIVKPQHKDANQHHNMVKQHDGSLTSKPF